MELGRYDVDSLLWQGLKRVLGRIMLVPVKDDNHVYSTLYPIVSTGATRTSFSFCQTTENSFQRPSRDQYRDISHLPQKVPTSISNGGSPKQGHRHFACG